MPAPEHLLVRLKVHTARPRCRTYRCPAVAEIRAHHGTRKLRSLRGREGQRVRFDQPRCRQWCARQRGTLRSVPRRRGHYQKRRAIPSCQLSITRAGRKMLTNAATVRLYFREILFARGPLIKAPSQAPNCSVATTHPLRTGSV